MERTRDWVAQAEWDLDHARSDLERGYYDWACFSAQQAAEKAVKAVFQKVGADVWGDSVGDLLSVKVFYPDLTRADVIRLLTERLPALNEKLPLVRAILFGSYARGNYTAASDIDLLVIYRGRKRADAFATVKMTLGLPRLEPHVYSEAEARRLARVINRMAQGGVVLWPAAGR